MTALPEKSVPELMRDNARLEAAMRSAIHEALRLHKLLGKPIVGWRGGQVVWIPPEEIELNGADHTEPAPPAVPDAPPSS